MEMRAEKRKITKKAEKTDSFMEQAKQKLMAREAELKADLGKFANATEIPDDYKTRFPKYGDSQEDNAMEVADFAHKLTLEKTLEKELKDVHKALRRIEEGSYGTCKYCQKPIEKGRLEARPTSNSCVACKKALKQEV